MVLFTNTDYTKMGVSELLKCKRSLIQSVNKVEKRKMKEMKLTSTFGGWIEDESIIYEHNLQELKKVIEEMERRMKSYEWLFDEGELKIW